MLATEYYRAVWHPTLADLARYDSRVERQKQKQLRESGILDPDNPDDSSEVDSESEDTISDALSTPSTPGTATKPDFHKQQRLLEMSSFAFEKVASMSPQQENVLLQIGRNTASSLPDFESSPSDSFLMDPLSTQRTSQGI